MTENYAHYFSAIREAEFGNSSYKEDLALAMRFEGIGVDECALVEDIFQDNRVYGLKRDRNNFAQAARSFAEGRVELRHIKTLLKSADYNASQLGIIARVKNAWDEIRTYATFFSRELTRERQFS